MRALVCLLLALSQNVLAAVDCGGNVTIRTPAQVEEVSASCEIIQGSLNITNSLYESATVSGVRVIKGGIFHTNHIYDTDSGYPKVYSLKFPDLLAVEGDLQFSDSITSEIEFPKLRVVNGTVWFSELTKRVDLRSLEYVGAFDVSGYEITLEEVNLDSLKGFAEGAPDGGYVRSRAVSAPVAQKAFFSRPLQPASDDLWPSIDYRADSYGGSLGISWPRINRLQISQGYNSDRYSTYVTLGGEDSTSMEIRNLTLVSNVGPLSRHSQLQDLTVGYFELFCSQDHSLEILFDNLAEFVNLCWDWVPTNITWPKKAENWNGLSVTSKTQLNLTANSTWYWPQEMRVLNLTKGDVHDDFFDEFFEKQVRVTETFYVEDYNGTLDCERFKDYEHIPADYYCDPSFHESYGVSKVVMAWGLQLGLTAITALALAL